jgi:hypothetical protein
MPGGYLSGNGPLVEVTQYERIGVAGHVCPDEGYVKRYASNTATPSEHVLD